MKFIHRNNNMILSAILVIINKILLNKNLDINQKQTGNQDKKHYLVLTLVNSIK